MCARIETITDSAGDKVLVVSCDEHRWEITVYLVTTAERLADSHDALHAEPYEPNYVGEDRWEVEDWADLQAEYDRY